MSGEREVVESNDIFEDEAFALLHEHDLMKLFDELTFREKWRRVFAGLKQPRESGPNKWARLQVQRLLAPVMAVIVPFLMLGLITLFAQFGPAPTTTVQVKVIDPEPVEQLEDIDEPEFEPPEPPDPIDMQVEFSIDAPAMPTDVAAPPAEAASVQPAEFDSVAMVRSPVVMRGMLGSRSPGAQGAALNRFGGGHTTEAVLRALRWLAKNQHRDGSWGQTKPAMASLALLAYLAHGDTPASEEFGPTVEAALRFLLSAQEPNTGRFRGRDGHDYTQPIAAYALAEAASMTRVPKVREAAIKAIEVVVKGQNPSGGFNYNLNPGVRNDTSYMAWCVQALKAADIAGLGDYIEGFDIAMKKSIDGFRKNYGERDGYGGFGYTGPSHSHGLSGAGALCMQFLGQGQSREVRNTLAGLHRWPLSWTEPPRRPLYFWYYNTQAYFQEGGAMWDNWNRSFSHGMVKAQQVISAEQSGYKDHTGTPRSIGFWESPCPAEATGGNNEVMDTILCTLMLEVYYRYLPTFQQVPQQEIDKELGDEEDLQIEIVSRGDGLQA